MTLIDKDRPSEQWIEDLRRRLPCETEIDRVLTRKLRRRAGPGYTPVALDALCRGVDKLLRAVPLEHPFTISDARWLSGGASKIQMLFKLSWVKPGLGPTETLMVLRMEPAESVLETSRLREFELMRGFDGVLPVPPVYWIDSEGTYLPYPAMICGFVTGVAKPSARVDHRVSGLGTNFGAAARPALGRQFLDYLGLVHTYDFSSMGLTAFDIPEAGTRQAAELQLNRWERVWEEDSEVDIPLMRLAAQWLRSNLPITDRLSIIHGDFRSGNFLYEEDDYRISSILDWELGHIGDRHDDLAYLINNAFGHLHEDGKTFLACGLMPTDDLLEAYEKTSGLPIIPKTLQYYKVLNAYKCVVMEMATCYRAAHGGKSHQDILLAWLSGLSTLTSEGLRVILEEVL